MAISLKEQLVQLRQIKDGTDFASILDEAWVTSGPGEYWKSERPVTIYHAPHVNVLKKGREDAPTREKATQMFYDFYAMELMHRLLGSPRPDPDIGKVEPGKLTPQQANKLKSAVGSAGMMGTNPMGAMFVSNWGDVENTPLGIGIVPDKLRQIIDNVYEEVTIQLTRKMMAHLRLTLVQEFRYLVSHAKDWQSFRQRLVAIYNKNNGQITKPEFDAAVAEKIPAMKGHEDAVRRLLKFCKYYSPMSPDPGDAIPKDVVPPEVGKPVEPEPEPEPEVEPEPEKPKTPEEPDDTDYDMPPVDIPPGADWGDEPYKYSDELEKEKIKQWLKQKKKLHESIHDPSYAAGRISPHTILLVKQAITKSGLTWDDILLAYTNLNWGGAYGGPKWGAGVEAFIKLMPQAKEQNVEDMAGIVDHIYDLEHNTGELLNKGGMYVAPHDLDRRAKITSLSRYLPNVSPVIQRLIMRVLGYVSKHPELEKDIRKVTQSPTQPFTPEQQTQLSANKFEQSSAGEEWTTQAPYENKKEKIVQNQYTVKFHTNGMFTVEDTMDTDTQVFDNWDDFAVWMGRMSGSFIKPQSGSSHYQPTKTMSEKELFLSGKTKIKLDGDKETKLLEECKMAWRPSNHYYKAYLPGNDRFQFFAFSDGTYMGCLKSTKAIGGKFDNWNDAFTYCKAQTANALPNEEYDEGKAWIGKAITANAPSITPKAASTQFPSVGSVASTEYTLGPIEINTLQILSHKVGGVTVESNVMPEGMTVFNVSIDASGVPMKFSVLAVGKKAISPTGKKYVVQHAVYGGQTEEWSFANWNQTLSFIQMNFAALIQTVAAVKDTVTASVTPQIFATPSSTPLPPPSTSPAAYKVHLGINKPPSHTIRLTEEDENIMKGLGFEPLMQGSDVWYIHKTIGDVVKFFPNDIAKILFIKTNNKVVVTKKIGEALDWLKVHYAGATKSPIASAPQEPSQKGSKAGAMYEKLISDKGFVWQNSLGSYIHKDNSDSITIAPFPKSIFVDNSSGEEKKFGNLPALAIFLKGYDGLKKKY